MGAALEDVADGSLFHDATGIHHRDLVAHLGHHAHVVGDKQDGRARALLQLPDQMQNLRLDGDVERGGRFVGDQKLRLAEQRHGDHHALLHAAGQLVRIIAEARRRVGDADG